MNLTPISAVILRKRNGEVVNDSPARRNQVVVVRRELSELEEIQSRQDKLGRRHAELRRKIDKHNSYGRDANKIELELQGIEIEFQELQSRKSDAMGGYLRNNLPQQLGWIPLDE